MKIRRFSEDFLPVVAVGDDARFLVQDTADGKVKYATKRQVVDGVGGVTKEYVDGVVEYEAATRASEDTRLGRGLAELAEVKADKTGLKTLQTVVGGIEDTLNDTVSPTLDRIASPAVRKVEYGDIERYISILISSKKVFFKSNGQLNFDDERVAMESLLGVLFVDEISRQNPFYLSEWLINVVDTDEYMGCIRIVPCVGGMSVWVDTLLSGSSLSWKWTRWDCSWEDWSPFTIQMNRVIYLSQTMEIYYPYDPNLAKTEQSGSKLLTKKLFGALYFNDFSQFASLATSDEDISILMYAYQIILFPADYMDTSPTQLHQRIDIKCNIGNSFTRPNKLRIAFIQRNNSSSNDKIVRMQWGQALQPLGSGAQSAPMINLYDVDAFLMLRFADFASGSITIENCVGMTGVQVSNPVTKLFESGVYNAG